MFGKKRNEEGSAKAWVCYVIDEEIIIFSVIRIQPLLENH